MWEREPQLIQKLSMLICLSSQNLCKFTKGKKPDEEVTIELDQTIREQHVKRAVQWFNEVRSNVDEVLQYANRTRETIPLDATMKVIQKHGQITRTQLIKNKVLMNLGIKSNQLNEIVRTLEDRGQITIERSDSGATIYGVKKRRGF